MKQERELKEKARDERIELKALKSKLEAKEKKKHDKERDEGFVVLSKKQKTKLEKSKKNKKNVDALLDSVESFNPFSALLNPDNERGVGREFAKKITKVSKTKAKPLPPPPPIPKSIKRRFTQELDDLINESERTLADIEEKTPAKTKGLPAISPIQFDSPTPESYEDSRRIELKGLKVKHDLQPLLRKYSLAVGGVKSELIKRIISHELKQMTPRVSNSTIRRLNLNSINWTPKI